MCEKGVVCGANRVKLVLCGEGVSRDVGVARVGVLLEDAHQGGEDEGDEEHCDACEEDAQVLADRELVEGLYGGRRREEDPCGHGEDAEDLRRRVALAEDEAPEDEAGDQRPAAEYHVEGHRDVVLERVVVQDARREEDRDVRQVERQRDRALPHRHPRKRPLPPLELRKQAHGRHKHKLRKRDNVARPGVVLDHHLQRDHIAAAPYKYKGCSFNYSIIHFLYYHYNIINS